MVSKLVMPIYWAFSNLAPVGAKRMGHACVRPAGTPGLWIGMAAWLGISGSLQAIEAGKIEYNRDIRPILSENCFACHGPDSASRKGDLRLDKREAALEKGAIAAGDVAESELINRIFSDDEETMMPPPAVHKKLTAEQKELLKAWIAAGAEYQPHWSLIAPVRPPLPTVSKPEWVVRPIDAFVLAKLDELGLAPNPEADKRTLCRRVALDLTGLPPEPEVLNDFLKDQSPEAYEKLVDKLMASPQWGEHRGRYWLDAARYADTHGIHFDNYREMWSFRDWVVKAFNKNQPFDEFTREQLAGDLLPAPTLDQQIASGFNRCNITTNEGGAIDEEYLVLYARDRTETTSLVWMGLTTGCAVCHDHKFDPISQKEFYELAAFFNNTTQRAMDGNIRNTPPTIPVPLPEDSDRFNQLPAEIENARAQKELRKQESHQVFAAWLPTASNDLTAQRVSGDLFVADLDESDGAIAKVFISGHPAEVPLKDAQRTPGAVAEQSLLVKEGEFVFPDVGDMDSSTPFSVSAWVRLDNLGQNGAIVARMTEGEKGYRGWDLWLEDGRIGTHLVSKWQDDAIKVVGRERIKQGEWTHVALTYDGSSKAGGVAVYLDGRKQEVDVHVDSLKGSMRTDAPFQFGRRHNQPFLNQLYLQKVQLFGRVLSASEVSGLGSLSRLAYLSSLPAEKRDAAANELLSQWWLNNKDAEYQARTAKLAALEEELNAIKGRGTEAHVMHEKSEPAMAYVLFRGDYDKRRDQVFPNTPSALPPLPPGAARNRLALADWLLTPQHPLTARVTVNRFWQEIFGTGLVKTAGDFGITGELPSHPQLLDYLAVDFRESGWDIKRFFKEIVMSSTYRQSSQVRPDSLAKDSANRFFSRGPRFRMDAEMVRDHALAASGLLVRKLGGPSVRPYQPLGVWEAVAMTPSDTRIYVQDKGEKLYRRSMYTFWKRAAPPASLEVFNAPAREVCTVRRERTNTPLQALVTLNDPQFVEAARVMAARTLHQAMGDDAKAMDILSERLLARPFSAAERPIVETSLADLRTHYAAHLEEAKQLVTVGEYTPDASLEPGNLAAWTMLVNQLMNLDEVLCK